MTVEAAAGSTGDGTNTVTPPAAGGAATGGASSASQGASGGGGASSSGAGATSTGSEGDAKALKEENERLKQENARLTGRVGQVKGDYEQRLTALETRLASSDQENATLKRQNRVATTTDAIVSQVPEAHRAVAKPIVRSYQLDGMDFAAEDSSAIQKAVLEKLGKEYPDLMKAPVAPPPNIPRIATITNGQTVGVEKTGVVKDGKRLL